MQAQRKFDEATTGPVADRAQPRAIESDLSAWDDAIAASPARRLHQELVAHFERGDGPQQSTAALPMGEARWTMPTRLAVIIGGSVALWAAIGGVAFALT